MDLDAVRVKDKAALEGHVGWGRPGLAGTLQGERGVVGRGGGGGGGRARGRRDVVVPVVVVAVLGLQGGRAGCYEDSVLKANRRHSWRCGQRSCWHAVCALGFRVVEGHGARVGVDLGHGARSDGPSSSSSSSGNELEKHYRKYIDDT